MDSSHIIGCALRIDYELHSIVSMRISYKSLFRMV
jgi:hypothetical protein